MMLDIRAIARAMGGDITGRNSCNVPGPSHNKRDRSLSILLNPRAPAGFVVFSHAGDDPIKCRDYVRGMLGLGNWQTNDERQPFVVTSAGPDQDKERLKRLALKIWAEAVNPIGSIVERYMREHRALSLTPDIAGSVIRFHGSLYFDEFTRLPGMVCLLRNIKSDEPCGIHRTFLNRETAEKIDRKMLGVAKEAAIKFDAAGETLTIGEGVETALSSREAGFESVWALGSSGAVRGFPVIKTIKELTILEENDPTSRRDVRECAHRYLKAKKPVNIVTPQVGNDFNDAWRAAQ